MRALVAEFTGTALLLAAIVGSGIMAERLAGGSVGLALLANTIASVSALVVLILIFERVSGAHFNPVVTMVARLDAGYLVAQVSGGIVGVMLANVMFGFPPIHFSTKARIGPEQWLSEFVATFGLLLTIGMVKQHTPFAIGLYIAAAYWFTPSTSFANPAVTIARSFSDSFAGIRPIDVGPFVAAQVTGGWAGWKLSRWMSK